VSESIIEKRPDDLVLQNAVLNSQKKQTQKKRKKRKKEKNKT
jgi:hypothetical protein